MAHPAPAQVIFDFNPFWLSLVIFVGSYAVIVSEKINRAIIGLIGGGLMILTGILSQDAALKGIDFNTLGLLLGMMIIVNITGKSGVFEYIAIWSAKIVGARPVGVLFMLAIVTALLSALLDNVTTVLLIVPVTIIITDQLKVSTYPYLVTEILFSNIGGTATLIGDPPNILIGSAAKLTFNDFIIHVAPVIPVIMFATLAVVYFIWGRKLVTTDEARASVLGFNEKGAIKNPRLVKQSMFVLALVLIGFVLGHDFHIQPATVAMFGAALLLLLDNLGLDGEKQSKSIHHTLGEAEWITLFFFGGLFVLVYGIEVSGVIQAMAEFLLRLTGGDLKLTALSILWGSAILSALVDNIPFVAGMIPLIKSMAPTMGGEAAILPLWIALSLGACLGGNGTLVGASANLVVAGFADRASVPIRFLPFMLLCFPIMLLSIAIAHIYVWMRYL